MKINQAYYSKIVTFAHFSSVFSLYSDFPFNINVFSFFFANSPARVLFFFFSLLVLFFRCKSPVSFRESVPDVINGEKRRRGIRVLFEFFVCYAVLYR